MKKSRDVEEVIQSLEWATEEIDEGEHGTARHRIIQAIATLKYLNGEKIFKNELTHTKSI
jgi:hypothetical protein